MVKPRGKTILLARASCFPRQILWNQCLQVGLCPPVLTINQLALPGIVSGAVIRKLYFPPRRREVPPGSNWG
jgi:hypothetical protein